MAQVSVAHPARRILIYSGMWFIVVWQSLAMIVSVTPESALSSFVRPIFDPYLTLFRLENGWGFFAPNVEQGLQFRYVVEDASGARHEFTPTDKLSRYDPTWIWMSDRFRMVMFEPEKYGDAFGQSVCREQAALNPVSVTLIAVDQERFWPEDWSAGNNPLDPAFVKQRTFKVVRCQPT
jgi:hypothetical protein